MLLLSTSSLKGYDINHIFSLANETTFQGIDLNVSFKNFDSFDAQYLKNLVNQHNLPIKTITAPEIITPSQLQTLIDLSTELKAETLIIQNPKTQPTKTANWIKNNIAKLQNEDLKIAIENAPAQYLLGIIPKNITTTIDDLQLFKFFSLNTTIIGEKKQDIFHIFDQIKNNLTHVRLANYTRNKKYTPPQNGVLPLENFLIKLKQHNFKGTTSIQVSPQQLKVGNTKEIIKNLTAIKKFYDQYFLKITTTPPDTTPNNPSDY